MAGAAGEALRVRTDSLVGAYRASQLFAFLPYQLLLSITFILFPMVARAHSRRENDAIGGYVRMGFRLALILAGLMVSCTSGLAPILLRFAFTEQAAADGGEGLRLLALGQGAFAIFGIETTVLVSLSRERSSAVLTGIASLLVGSLCWVLVPSAPFDGSLLSRTALATSLALAGAAVAGAVLVRRACGSFASAKTLTRTAMATGAAIAVGALLPWWSRALVPVQVLIVVVVYLTIAIVLGELTTADIVMIRRSLGRRPP
jgi:stage V sporulation protein B